MKRTIRPFARAALIGAIAATAAGCSPQQQSLQAPAEQGPAASSATRTPPNAFDLIKQMSPEDKRAQLGANFPLEIPVPAGTAVLGNTRGPDAWDYQIEVARDPLTVRDWYIQAYQKRGWEVVDTGLLTQGVPGYYFTARKNAAETRVDLVGESGAPRTVARVVVGVGAPVIDAL